MVWASFADRPGPSCINPNSLYFNGFRRHPPDSRGRKSLLQLGKPQVTPTITTIEGCEETDRELPLPCLPAREDFADPLHIARRRGHASAVCCSRARRGAGDRSSVMKFSRALRICPTLMLRRLTPTLRLHVELFQKSANALLDLVSDGSYCMQRLAGGVG